MGLFGTNGTPDPGPPDDEGDDDDDESSSSGPGPESAGLVRTYLSIAIQIGAPAYNGGDHRGCYEVYACTARLLVCSGKARGTDAEILRLALENCAVEVDVDQQAWMMRRAFDAILAGAKG